MKYTIIAPAYNEAENVAPLVDKITEAMEKVGGKYEIMIIDDGSTDETFENLRLLQERYDTLTVISLMENSGQTVAYQAGFDHAKGERIVTMDSDLEKDPAYILDMIEKMDAENLDIVYFRKEYVDVPLKRKLASKAANVFRRIVTGDEAEDVGSTYLLYRENFLKGRNYTSGFHRFFIGFMEVEGRTMGHVEGKVYVRPHGVTKYTNWGRLKQGLSDLFFFYLYKNKRINAIRLIIGASVITALVLVAPVHWLIKSSVLALFLLIIGFLAALSLHSVHLLVQMRRLPYRIKEVWPSRNRK